MMKFICIFGPIFYHVTLHPQTEDVFAKLKSREVVENLKELYDKIPDITKTEIIKETEEWSTSVPSTEKVLQVIPAYTGWPKSNVPKVTRFTRLQNI